MGQNRKLVFFDIDGTLVLTKGAGKLALGQVFSNEFGIKDPKLDIDFGGRTDRSIARELFEINGIKWGDEQLLQLFTAYLTSLEEHLEKGHGELLPGVLDLLVQLKTLPDVDVGLITGNVEQGAYKKLAQFDIDHFFAFGGFGDNQELRDDIAKEGLVRASQHTGHTYNAEYITVIGDTPHDITCSDAIGAKCIAVKTGYSHPDSLVAANPYAILDDLSNTENVLRLILRS